MYRILQTLSLLVIVLMSGITVNAQEEGVGITGKGIKLGSAWGSLNTNDSVFDAGATGGFTGGAFLTYNITPRLAIQPELMYVQKGTGDNNFFGGDGYNLGYLEFPVLLKYNLSTGRRLIPSVFLGPAVSTLLSAEIYYDGFFTEDERYDVKDGMKSVDFGLVLGGEVVFRSTKPIRFFLDVRYTLGLANVVDPVKWNEGRKIVDEGDFLIFHWIDYDRPLINEDSNIKNRVFTFLIGLKF
jgi:hypothetical protein